MKRQRNRLIHLMLAGLFIGGAIGMLLQGDLVMAMFCTIIARLHLMETDK